MTTNVLHTANASMLIEAPSCGGVAPSLLPLQVIPQSSLLALLIIQRSPPNPSSLIAINNGELSLYRKCMRVIVLKCSDGCCCSITDCDNEGP
jgi:hypothetical protein